ncbi:MrcB family domain-containing protein [Chromobacterium piscinae]|uniref:MrcB family domain-containing protein n=1 Tax=Chromobacterium piscinae TaxID=686831 RepID=UPI003F80C2CF
MNLLKTVFDNYFDTRTALEGKASYVGRPDQISLQQDLPAFFREILKDAGRQDEFKVEGSFGNGNMARVPWVAIFNTKITKSAQDGYYIVLLFSEDLKSCYLSLNQGVTSFEKQYSLRLAQQKLKETARFALNYFNPDPNAVIGEIDLLATGHLGKGYERGAIESFRYGNAALPTPSEMATHFKILLDHYDKLVIAAGDALQLIMPIREEQYQQAVLDKSFAKESASKVVQDDLAGGVPVPNKARSCQNERYIRNPSIAAIALARAEFKCEIDPSHQTFISSSKNLPYIEAHHLIPMSEQSYYQFSLDVAANIVALCPTCHKLLHYGRFVEKRKFLLDLYRARQEKLLQKNILISEDVFLECYRKNIIDAEA